MLSPTESFKELVKLTQLYLSQKEYDGRWIMSSPEMTSYYREFASGKKNKLHDPVKVLTPPKPVQSDVKVTIPPSPPVSKITFPEKEQASNIPSPTLPVPVPAPEPQATGSESKKKVEPFTLTPQTPIEPIDLSDIKKIITEKFPSQVIIDTIPEYHTVVKKTTNSPPAVIIISMSDKQEEIAFLHNLAKAISDSIAPAKIVQARKINEQKAWKKLIDSETVKLILMNDTCLYSYPELLPHYRSEPGSSKLYLGNKHLLILSDIQQYLAQLPLKRALWTAIKNYDL